MKKGVLYRVLKDLAPYDLISDYSWNFESRLIAQKIIYMFQKLNNVNSFNYSWYLNGPYSSELTEKMYNDIITMSDKEKTKFDKKSFNEKGMKMLSKVESFFRFIDEHDYDMDKDEAYELAASLYYLNDRYEFKDDSDLIKKLIENKPKYTKEITEKVLSDIRAYLKN